jgi:hypothetical protein
MPPRSKIEKLPLAVRNAIDKRLVDSNFSDYAEIASELYKSGHRISKSAVHRYGRELERRVQMGRAHAQLAAAGIDADLAAELTGDATLVVVIDRRNGRARLVNLRMTPVEIIKLLKGAA